MVLKAKIHDACLLGLIVVLAIQPVLRFDGAAKGMSFFVPDMNKIEEAGLKYYYWRQ